MKTIVPLLALLAACSQRNDEPVMTNHQQPAQAAPEAQMAPPAAAGNAGADAAIDPKSPEAAAAVLRDYFTAIGEHRYADAWRLWADNGRASGVSEAEFAASFDRYFDFHGGVGEIGQMEGAAGSSYVDIPVDVTGHLQSGERFKQSGTITLRRVNDVPGATPEQLQWRIYKSGLSPNVPTSAG